MQATCTTLAEIQFLGLKYILSKVLKVKLTESIFVLFVLIFTLCCFMYSCINKLKKWLF